LSDWELDSTEQPLDLDAALQPVWKESMDELMHVLVEHGLDPG